MRCEGLRITVSVTKAKTEFQKLKKIVKPDRQEMFMRIHGETETEALKRYVIGTAGAVRPSVTSVLMSLASEGRDRRRRRHPTAVLLAPREQFGSLVEPA
jgi:hypothetical protein